MIDLTTVATGFFLFAGAAFFVATTIGMFRFDNVYARLHSAGKCLTGGVLSIIVAAMLQAAGLAIFARLAIAALLLLGTSTLGAHSLARASHQLKVDRDSLEDDSYAQAVEGGLVLGEPSKRHDNPEPNA